MDSKHFNLTHQSKSNTPKLAPTTNPIHYTPRIGTAPPPAAGLPPALLAAGPASLRWSPGGRARPGRAGRDGANDQQSDTTAKVCKGAERLGGRLCTDVCRKSRPRAPNSCAASPHLATEHLATPTKLTWPLKGPYTSSARCRCAAASAALPPSPPAGREVNGGVTAGQLGLVRCGATAHLARGNCHTTTTSTPYTLSKHTKSTLLRLTCSPWGQVEARLHCKGHTPQRFVAQGPRRSRHLEARGHPRLNRVAKVL